MSSTAARTGAKPAPAPWRTAFLADLSQMDSPELVLATLHPVASSSASSSSPFSYVPRARTCIYRGMWADLPTNPKNSAPRNSRVYESDCPTITTDVRMQKVGEMFASSAGRADDDSLVQGSGGGGPVEAVWWVKGDVMTQWRIRGDAFIVGPDIDAAAEKPETGSSGVRTVKSEIGKRMRVVGEGEWSWEKELTVHFGNVSPAMRGTFKQPPPGQPVSEPYNDKECAMGQKVEDLHDEVCRRNFRVVIIRPKEVESVCLKDPAQARRQKYTYIEDTGEWAHEVEWP